MTSRYSPVGSKATAEQSHSIIFGYHAQIGVIRTSIVWERSFWHSFARASCPQSDSTVKRALRESSRNVRSAGIRAPRETLREHENSCYKTALCRAVRGGEIALTQVEKSVLGQ